MSEGGKKLLKDLSKQVRDKLSPGGEPLLNQKGLALIEEMVKELNGPEGMPGLHLLRDGPHKFRLQRPRKNAEITVEWERSIGAAVMTGTELGHVKRTERYVWDEAQTKWRRLDGLGEIYEDLSTALVELLYPEGRG
jgi:hypothetical protein